MKQILKIVCTDLLTLILHLLQKFVDNEFEGRLSDEFSYIAHECYVIGLP